MQAKQPLVSVIMAVYNAEKFLSKSLDSVLGQSYSNFELILIDDCSTDSSLAIERSYADRDSRIVLLQNRANGGAAVARNKGLDNVHGDYIAFLDSDDLISPERLAKQVAFFDQHPDVDLCGSYYIVFNEELGERVELKVPVSHERIIVEMLFGSPFALSAVMMRREPFERTGVRFKPSRAEDYQLWTEVYTRMRMANIPEYLFFYRQWSEQISTKQLAKQNIDVQTIHRLHFHNEL